MYKRKTGIIFDLDGTLWDATGMAARIWNSVFEERNLALRLTPADVKAQMGKTMAEIAQAFFPELPREDQIKIMDLLGEQEVIRMHEGGDRLYDGAAEVLAILSRVYPLFIVSNCQRDYARGFMYVHGFRPLFTDYEESGRTGLGKADNIRLLIKRNGLRRAVYVGDTESDARAARAAGVDFIFAAYGFGDVERPEYVIDSLRALPDLMASLR